MDSENIYLFFEPIVIENYEDEFEDYKTIGRDVISNILQENDNRLIHDTEHLEFEFGESVELAFKFIEILLATLPLIIEIWKLKNENDNKKEKSRILSIEDFESRWQKELLQNGLTNEKSNLIAKKYTNDLHTMIKNMHEEKDVL